MMARILLADDDQGALDFMRRALEMDGHAVTTADDGIEALGQLGTSQFDVLVSDVQMPGLDGISLAEKALAQAPALRILMMSGFADVLEKARGLKSASSVRFLAKPFAVEQLRNEIRSLMA